MGVFTCHRPKAFVCVFIKLVYHCIQWKLNVSVYASSNAKADSLSCPIVESRYVFTRFRKAEGSFGCCCQNTIDIRIQVFVCKYQCLTKIAWVNLVCGV